MCKATPYHHRFLSRLEGWDKTIIIHPLLWVTPDPLMMFAPEELIMRFIIPDDLILLFIPGKLFAALFQTFDAVLVINERFP